MFNDVKLKYVSFRIDEDLANKIEEIANNEGVRKSVIYRKAVEDTIKKYEKKKDK